jgi:hypothetical protein
MGAGRRALILAVAMALAAIQRRVLADHLKIRVRLVTRFALLARHHARLPGLRVDDAAVAIGAQHVLRHTRQTALQRIGDATNSASHCVLNSC